jgi:hypothetical protein
MRSVLGSVTAIIVVLGAGAAGAQTFLSPGALMEGTRGYIGPAEPMTLQATTQGRSVATSTIKATCDLGDVVLCYPGSFRAIADVAGQ